MKHTSFLLLPALSLTILTTLASLIGCIAPSGATGQPMYQMLDARAASKTAAGIE